MEEGITLDAIRAVVYEAVAVALESRDAWLDTDQAAAYVGVHPATIHNLVSKKRLPRYGEPGTALKFRRADLDAYVASKGRQA